jgi:hypothetical protein
MPILRAVEVSVIEFACIKCMWGFRILQLFRPTHTHHSLLTTHYSLLTTHYSLLTTNYSLLTTHYSLLTTNY